MSQHLIARVQLHTEPCVGKCLSHRSLNFEGFLLLSHTYLQKTQETATDESSYIAY
jgi:hypothetical protein